MEWFKCVVFLLNVILYSARFDFVVLHNLNDGPESDAYNHHVDNMVNDKRTINTLRKINNGKTKHDNDGDDLHEVITSRLEMKEKLSRIWLPAVHKIWKYWHKSGARSVMNTITSKLVRHASDKITKHVGKLIRSSVTNKKTITAQENGHVRSPLSSATSVVLPALSIAKLNDKGYDNTTVSANVKDLKSAEAPAEKSSPASNSTSPSLNATSSSISPSLNSTNNAADNNNKTTIENNHTFSIKYQNDAGDLMTPNAYLDAPVQNETLETNALNTTSNSTATKAEKTAKHSSVPIATNKHHQNVLRRSGKHSHHSRQLVNSFVDAPPIGPMESISIDLKGKASTFKNFSKTYKQTTELERPSKTEYLNYYKNPPISNELTSTLSANTSPYHSVPSLSPAQYVATTTNTNQSVSSNTSASPFTKDKDEESGSSSGDEDEEISGDNGGSFKISAKLNSNKNKLKLSSDTKKLLSQKVPILAIETGSDNVKSAHVSKKVKSKKHKRKQKTKKITNETRHNKKKQLHEYKVLPSDSLLENATSLDTDPLGDDGLVNLDLSSLANTSLQNGAGINSIELEGGHKLPTNGPVTFNLGHNARLMLDELPPPEKEEPEKGPLHSGHNHPGEHGIDHDLPQDQLVKGHEQGPLLPGHEQGPLLPGHEQGPLLPGQDHPGDFSHHDEGEGESKLGEGKFTHIQPSGPNIVEEPLQKPPVPAEINPGIPNAVTNFPNGLHIPSHHPLLSINGLPGLPPLNTPALLAEEEKACALKPPLVAGTLDCPPHSDYPYHHQETTELPAHNEEPEPIAPTGHPPTLPFEIPSHHKFESLGHNVEPELLSIIESNNQQVTSLSHEVKNIESRLGNVESIVEVLEKAVYRIEEKVDKLNSPVPTFTQREEFAEEPAPPPPRARHPLLKQYFVPMTSANAFDSGAPGGGIKELDRNPNNGGLPWPVNKMVSYLLQEIQKGKNKQTLMQLQGTPHVPLPQAELAYPPKEHDIDRLEFEIGRVPQKSKFYHYDLDAPCQCENGGECNGRNDVCDCPLRFTGPRCERPVPRSALLDSIIDEMPTAENQQQQFLHTPKKTSLITLPLVISENNDDGTDSTSKTVGEVNQSKIVNLLSQFFSPDYLQRLAKREKVSTRRYVKYPLEKEK